jgi:hypothetical protein
MSRKLLALMAMLGAAQVGQMPRPTTPGQWGGPVLHTLLPKRAKKGGRRSHKRRSGGR